MSHSAEQLARALTEKAGRIEEGYRHDNSVAESFFTRILRKTLARILRPLTSIIKETAELNQSTALTLSVLQENLRELGSQMEAAGVRQKRFQELQAETAKNILELQVDFREWKNLTQQALGVSAPQSSSFHGHVWDEFYKRFEDRFRGDPKSITDRLEQRYKDKFVSIFASRALESSKVPLFIDLGCGRGELLNIGRDIGFKTIGVDSGTAMVKEIEQHGHEAHLSDIYCHLKTCPDASVDVLTLFHVIEHCPADYSLKLFKEASRVLKPGGVFVVETPSIFSLWVTARQFHLDPTHTHPVHPDYMAFMAQDSGFSQTSLIEFEPVNHSQRASMASHSVGAITAELRTLEHWLFGPQDICLWATK